MACVNHICVGLVSGMCQSCIIGLVSCISQSCFVGMVSGMCQSCFVAVVSGMRQSCFVGLVNGMCQSCFVGLVNGMCQSYIDGLVSGMRQSCFVGLVNGMCQSYIDGLVSGMCQSCFVGFVSGMCQSCFVGFVSHTLPISETIFILPLLVSEAIQTFGFMTNQDLSLVNVYFVNHFCVTTGLMCSIFSNATEETKEREKVTKETAGTHGDGLRLPRSHRNKPQRHNQSLTQQHALTQW